MKINDTDARHRHNREKGTVLFSARPMAHLSTARAEVAYGTMVRAHLRHDLWVYLVGLIILGIIGYLYVAGDSAVMEARSIQTQKIEDSFITATEAYATEYSLPPGGNTNASLVNVLAGSNLLKIQFLSFGPRDRNPDGELLDAWGRPFHISNLGKVVISSAGADGQWNTRDDITTRATDSPTHGK